MTPSRPRPLVLEALESRLTPVSFGTASGYTAGSNGTVVATGDLNGDGYDDAVFGDVIGGTIPFLGSSSGALTQIANVPISGPRRIILADMNGDTKLDVVVANSGGQQVVVALGNGDGTFQTPIATAVGANALDIGIADFDGDGKLDVAVACAGVRLLRGNGTASLFDPVVQITTGADDEYLTVGDFNGDEKTDIATGVLSGDAVHVLLNSGNGTFASTWYSLGQHGGKLAAGDFDGNGRDDIVVAYGDYPTFALMMAKTDGTFQPGVEYATIGAASGFAIADYDLDGKMDLAVADFGGSRAWVYIGHGDGTFESAVQAATGLYPSWTAAGDFNGDGLPDLVSSNATSPASINVALNTTVVSLAAFEVSAPATATAGQSVTVTVTARTPGGSTFAGFTGAVQLTSTDGQATFPGTITFTAADRGVKTVTITFGTVGSQTITATDLSTSSAGTSNAVAVAPVAFEVSAPATATAGQPVVVTVTARTAGGSTFAGFTGAVQLTSTDGQATFPGTITFTAADRGVKTVTVTFGTVGNQTLTATDLSTSSAGTSNAVAVANSPVVRAAATLTLTALDGPTVFGDTARFLVAVAQVGNSPVPSGTIRFTNAATHEVLGDVSLDATGRAVLSTAMLPAGTNTIAASYSGDAAYLQAGGVTVTQVVDRQARTAVGSDAGPVATVQVFDPRTGALLRTLFPFDQYTLGVKVATGDVNGDGISDIVVSAGAGAPGGHVKVYNGINYAVLASFFTFPGYTGGVNVGVGDVDDDGFGDVVVGTAVANDHVKAFSSRLLLTGASADFSTIQSFFAYGGGNPVGVTVGTGDVDGDGRADIVTGSATFAGHVKAFSGAGNGNLIGSYFAYGAGYLGGIYVAGGDLDGDGRAEIITGATNAPHVKALRLNGAEVASFFAYLNADGTPANFGVRVGAVDRNRDRLADVLTGSGGAAPAVKTFSGLDPAVLLESFIATPPGQSPSASGIFVAGSGR